MKPGEVELLVVLPMSLASRLLSDLSVCLTQPIGPASKEIVRENLCALRERIHETERLAARFSPPKPTGAPEAEDHLRGRAGAGDAKE